MRSLITTVMCLALVFCSQAQFIHPGMMHNKQDLQFLKAKVKAGEVPWTSLWNDLEASPEAALSWTPQPRKVIVVGFYSKPDIGASEFTKDGDAAYTLALRYYVSGEKAYAKKAVEIINAWSYALDSVTDGNKKLLVGMNGIKYLNAAEILKHSYKGWKKKDQKAFEKMVAYGLVPVAAGFYAWL